MLDAGLWLLDEIRNFLFFYPESSIQNLVSLRIKPWDDDAAKSPPNRRFEAELRWMLIVGGLRACAKKDSAPTFMQKIQNVSHVQGLGAGLSDTRNRYCVHFS